MEYVIALNILGIIIAIVGVVMAKRHPKKWAYYIFGLVGIGVALNIVGIILQSNIQLNI